MNGKIEAHGRYLKKLRALFNGVMAKKDAKPQEYATLYHQIPEKDANTKNVFYRRILSKAKAEKWPRDKVAETLSLLSPK